MMESNNLLQPNDGCVDTVMKTPEIIQSLLAISPLDECIKQQNLGSTAPLLPIQNCKAFSPDYSSEDTCSSTNSNSIVESPVNSVPSMKSQLIKEGLKLTLQQKLYNNASASPQECDSNPKNIATLTCNNINQFIMDITLDDDGNVSSSSNSTLTQEDEERRRRRRERNKVAATKCRIKKREQAKTLECESEELESKNSELKSKIQDLVNQKRALSGILNVHKPNCINPSPEQTPQIMECQQHPPSFNNIAHNHLNDPICAKRDYFVPSDLAVYSNFGIAAQHWDYQL